MGRVIRMLLLMSGDVEPHPGPARYASKNVNGLATGTKLFHLFRAIRTESRKDPLTAVFIQEHNLPRAERMEHARLARQHQLLFVPAYAPPVGVHKVCWGGTAIIIPNAAIMTQLKPGEDLDTAKKSTLASRWTSRGSWGGRFVSVAMRVDGFNRRLASAYAPAEVTQQVKRGDFFDAIARKVAQSSRCSR